MMDYKDILEAYKKDELDLDSAAEKIKKMSAIDLGFANVDMQREARVGYPEVIYCEGKTNERIEKIAAAMVSNGIKNILATRADNDAYEAIKKIDGSAVYHKDARIVIINYDREIIKKRGKIVVITAGTADIPVGEEAAVTAEILGNCVERIYDVGVAGLHRLTSRLEIIRSARVIICIAGMEGALASVVAGLVDKPVIAVPTSVGYGASFGGLSALLTMINSCASGIAVVNIDNGFGAGYIASNINKLGEKDENIIF